MAMNPSEGELHNFAERARAVLKDAQAHWKEDKTLAGETVMTLPDSNRYGFALNKIEEELKGMSLTWKDIGLSEDEIKEVEEHIRDWYRL